MACYLPPSADLQPLRNFLKRFDVPDCHCPLLLNCPCGQECTGPEAAECVHCREECDCKPLLFQPPCRHVQPPDPADVIELREWHRRLWPRHHPRDDAECWERLCARAYPNLYLDPATPPPDTLTQSKNRRIEIMEGRTGQGLAIRHPCDRWAEDERPEAAQVVSRRMNGSVKPEGLIRA